jgi:predicted O-linked N-acetylglucosamine transferase (SPINDLY family)
MTAAQDVARRRLRLAAEAIGQQRLHAVVAECDAALRADPTLAAAAYLKAMALEWLGRHDVAGAAFEQAEALQPGIAEAAARAVQMRLQVCDWSQAEADAIALRRLLREEREVPVFALRAIGPTLEELGRATAATLRRMGPLPAPLPAHPRPAGERLRIGYFSSDLHVHPVGFLMAGVLERHVQARFETFAFAHGQADGSAQEARLAKAVTHFEPIGALDDAAAAGMIQARGIDVLVDLNGMTQGERPPVLMRRPAPVQVNMLSYLGPINAPWIDYTIADPFVLPEDVQVHYRERIVRLPHAYLPPDLAPPLPPEGGRAAHGLPAAGVVFCNFSAGYKIAPAVFAVWMRLLRAIDGSVLWLHAATEAMRGNLARAAAAAGVDPARLVFAPRVAQAAYRGRMTLADVFLDTLPCSACTTGVDALASGLPVLTCAGEIFAGRHAGSSLLAAGLPELVTSSLVEYEAMALRLAREPGLLAEFRARLARRDAPLFDLDGYTRSLETIYRRIAARQRAGLPPQSFTLAPGEVD